MIRRALIAALLVGGALLLRPAAAQQEAAAERLLHEAQRLQREGKTDEARTEYELLVQRFPDRPEAEQAQLALAETYWQAGDADRARTLLDTLTNGKPDSPAAAAGWVLRGRFLVEQAATRAELEEARTPFRRVPVLFGSAEYPQLAARVEARVRSGEVSLLLGEPELAALDFVEAIEDEHQSSWLPRALYGFARSLLAQGDRVAGADTLQRVLAEPDAGDALRRDAAIDLAYLQRHWIRPAVGQPRWATARAVAGLTLGKPQKLAVSRDGRVLIWDDDQDQVLILGPTLEVESRSSQTQVRDVWWSADGRPYAALADAVVALDDGSRRELSGAGAALRDLAAGASGVLGELFVVDRDRKALLAFDRKGAAKTLSATAGDVVDLAVGSRGELLMLDRRKSDVSSIGLDGAAARGFTGSWRRAQALAVDPSGNVIVLDGTENTIEVRDAAGEQIGEIGPVLPGGIELRSPEDVAVDGSGRLYVVDSRLAQLLILE
jgi:TolA-binding protein